MPSIENDSVSFVKLLVLLQPNMGSVVKPHKTVALPFVVMAMLLCDVFSNSCCTHTYVLYIYMK